MTDPQEHAAPASAGDEPAEAAAAEPAPDAAAAVDGGDATDPGPLGAADAPATVEELIALLERTAAERDEYLDVSRRLQADFENYRKRVAKQQAEDAALGAAKVVEQLLPVLDACDGAVHHGATEVEPIYASLLQTLEKQGLERIDPDGEAFDPTRHEAVMHEPAGEGEEDGTVAAVLRAGYAWQGRVLRPAMVKVRG